MNKTIFLRLCTFFTIAIMLSHTVFAINASRSILIFNLNDDPNDDRVIPNDEFQELIAALSAEGFAVEIQSSKDGARLDRVDFDEISQIWVFETDLSRKEARDPEIQAIIDFNAQGGGVLFAAEEDAFFKSQSKERDFLGELGDIFSFGLGFLDPVTLIGVIIFAAVRSTETFSSDYGSLSSTDQISGISQEFGANFIGLSKGYNCETGHHYQSHRGAAAINPAAIKDSPRYTPFCMCGGCSDTILDDHNPIYKLVPDHPIFEGVNSIFFDGREPELEVLVDSILNGSIVPLAQTQHDIPDLGHIPHTFVAAHPLIIKDNKINTGKVVFDTSWRRFSNEAIMHGGDTKQYAINIAEYLEIGPYLSKPSCEDPERANGNWRNFDDDINTVHDNCCFKETELALVNDFACLKVGD